MKPPKQLLKLVIVPVIGGYAIKKDDSQLDKQISFMGRYDTIEEAQQVLSLVRVALFACNVVKARKNVNLNWETDLNLETDSAIFKLERALTKAGCTNE